MKFPTLFTLVYLLFSTLNTHSQCIPDENFIPVGANYGLLPDSLNDGVLNQEYSQVLTFYLPKDTLVDVDGVGESLIEFEDYHITSISLPLGLSWECNNFDSQCHYNPMISQHGCVSLFGTPLEFGEFEVEVTVIATHELSFLVGTETISFVLPLTILPNSSENAGFVMTNYSGCAPLTVDFTNNNLDQASYYWNFGNGNVSDLENPPSQLYTDAGIYEVHYMCYSSLEPLYFLTEVQVNSASGWDGDIDDGFGALNPDPYFILFDSEGNQIFQSNAEVDNSFPVSWGIDNIALSNQNYTIQVWDEDGVTNNDNLGSISFNGNTSSSTLTNGDLTVSYTILEVEPLPYADVVDTVFVYESPNQPNVEFDEVSSQISCLSDSLDLTYQWYFNNSPVPNANSLSFYPTASGFYYLSVTNAFGCSDFSDEQMLTICDDEYIPEIEVNHDTLSIVQLSNLDYQWMFEGEEILNANSSTYVAQEDGSYSLVLSDEWGCKFISEELNFSLLSVQDFNNVKFSIFPNPATDYIEVVLMEGQSNSITTIEMFDVQGREVIRQEMRTSKLRLDVAGLMKGTYVLRINSNGQFLTKRILIY